MTTTVPPLITPTVSWHVLSNLHDRVQAELEHALQARHGLSVREYRLLDVISRQPDGEGSRFLMKHISDAVTLSQSATSRLVARLETRGLLRRSLRKDDRRGIRADLSPEGLELLLRARPTWTDTLREALEKAAEDPRLRMLIDATRAPECDDIPSAEM